MKTLIRLVLATGQIKKRKNKRRQFIIIICMQLSLAAHMQLGYGQMICGSASMQLGTNPSQKKARPIAALHYGGRRRRAPRDRERAITNGARLARLVVAPRVHGAQPLVDRRTLRGHLAAEPREQRQRRHMQR
jgi:hypothetical protein